MILLIKRKRMFLFIELRLIAMEPPVLFLGQSDEIFILVENEKKHITDTK